MKGLGLTARSETRRGFTMPSLKKIKTALRQKSKSFLIGIVISMFAKLSKTEKIRILIKIERGAVKRIRKATRKRKSKTKKRKSRTKTRKSKGRKKGKQHFKIITIKKRGGGKRKQRVLVLASGKFRFVKNR